MSSILNSLKDDRIIFSPDFHAASNPRAFAARSLVEQRLDSGDVLKGDLAARVHLRRSLLDGLTQHALLQAGGLRAQ